MANNVISLSSSGAGYSSVAYNISSSTTQPTSWTTWSSGSTVTVASGKYLWLKVTTNGTTAQYPTAAVASGGYGSITKNTQTSSASTYYGYYTHSRIIASTTTLTISSTRYYTSTLTAYTPLQVLDTSGNVLLSTSIHNTTTKYLTVATTMSATNTPTAPSTYWSDLSDNDYTTSTTADRICIFRTASESSGTYSEYSRVSNKGTLHYTFTNATSTSGWNTTSRTGSASVDPGEAVSVTTSSITITASGSYYYGTTPVGTVTTPANNYYSKTGYSYSNWVNLTDGTTVGCSSSLSLYLNTASTGTYYYNYYPQWTADTYPVTYYAGDATSGTAPAAQTKTYGTNLTLQTNSGSLAHSATSSTATLTQTFSANGGSSTKTSASTTKTTTNTYSNNGWGTSSGTTTKAYDFGGTYSTNASINLYPAWSISTGYSYTSCTLPTTSECTRTGYTLTGWTSGSTTKSPGASITPTASATWTANWSVNSYTVTLSKGTGVSTIYYRIGTSGSWTTYSAAFSASYGSTVQAYCDASAGYTADYTSSSPMSWTMSTSAVTKTLTATPNDYTVTLNKGTGVSTIYYRIGTSGSWITYSAAFTATYGNTVQAYCTANTGYTADYTSSSPMSWTMSSAAVTKTLTATGNSYSVRFNANGGSGSMSNQSFTYGTAQALTANAFTAPTGKQFKGWDTSSAGTTVVYTNQQSVSNLTSTSGGVVDLYAVWGTITYTVTIAVNNSSYGSVSTTSVTDVPYGTVITTSSNTVSINGTTVTATAASQTAQYTYAFSSWTNGTATVTSNITVTANFTRTTRSYTVTIAVSPSGYGSVSTSSVTSVPYGTVITTSSNTVNINGTTVTATAASQTAQYTYAFSSWTNGTATVTGALTVTANFTRTLRSYTVTISAGSGGSVSPISFTSVSYGTTYSSSGTTLTVGSSTCTATPNSGYYFSGWSPSSGTVTGNTTINASFAAESTAGMSFNINGTWTAGSSYANVNGVWRACIAYVNDNGTWKIVSKTPVTITNLLNPSNFSMSSVTESSGVYTFATGTTAMITQSLDTPTVGHIYYGRCYQLAASGLSVADGRFEYFGGDGTGKNIVFATASDTTQDSAWHLHSSLQSFPSLSGSGWTLRSFTVNSTTTFQRKEMMIIDLTASFGSGSEPTLAWCNTNIPYFTGSITVPAYC